MNIHRKLTLKGGGYAPVSVDAELQAWRSAVAATGGSVSDLRAAIVGQFLRDLKATGLLRLLDQINAWWAENEAQACVCLVSRRVATPINSPVFEANKGVSSDGLGAYYDTNYRPNAHARAVTGGNAHIGAQVLTSVAAGSVSVMGAGSGTTWRLVPRFTGDLARGQVGSAIASFPDSVPTSVGYLAAQRAGGTTMQGWKNDSALTDTTVASTSTGLPQDRLYVLARNNSGPAADFFPGQVGLTYVGAPLTSAQWMTLRAAIRIFGQSVGAL